MNRRDFLKSAAIAPAAIAASRWIEAAEAPVQAPGRITAVVYDERYENCSAFAEGLIESGAAAYPTSGDAARVWYGPLRAHLARHGGRVAGMTTDADWGVSRLCGREANLRIAYEGSHDCRRSGLLVHRLRGFGTEQEVYAALLKGEKSWAASIGGAVNRASANNPAVNFAASSPLLTTFRPVDHRGYLTSWLLIRNSSPI